GQHRAHGAGRPRLRDDEHDDGAARPVPHRHDGGVPMTRGVAALLGLVLVAAARHAGAVCTAAEVIAGCGGSCTFDATTGTISRTVAVVPTAPGGACTFDFGTREITLAGSFIGGPNAFELRAVQLTILSTGRLSASGGLALLGGIIKLTLRRGGRNVEGRPARSAPAPSTSPRTRTPCSACPRRGLCSSPTGSATRDPAAPSTCAPAAR